MSDKDKVKAFKAAFGFKPDSTDWGKIRTATLAQVPILLKWVVILEQNTAPDALEARNHFTTINQSVNAANAKYTNDAAAGGKEMRDTVLPALLWATDKYRKSSKNAPRTVNLNGTNVDVHWTDIPGFEDMNVQDRAAAALVAATKIVRGKQVIQTVANASDAKLQALGSGGPAAAVKPDSKEWAKIRDAMEAQLDVLESLVVELETAVHDAAPDARGDLDRWRVAATSAISDMQKDTARAGEFMRDTILPAVLQLTKDYGAMVDPDDLAAATPEDVTDFVWAAKAMAQDKAGPYNKGALTIPHGEKLRAFLDTCTDEVYPRKSSHLKEQQDAPGQCARGMDFYDGADDLANGPSDKALPSGMNTLLYQQVTAPDGSVLLYVKMESEGAYGSGASKDPTAPQPRPKRDRDNGALVAHGWNYVKATLGSHDQDKDLKARREDADKRFKPLCNAIVKALTDKGAKAKLKSAMGSKLRINSVCAALEEINDDGLFNDECDGPIEAFIDAIEEVYGGDLADLLKKFGDEVTLNPNDLV